MTEEVTFNVAGGLGMSQAQDQQSQSRPIEIAIVAGLVLAIVVALLGWL